MKNDKSMERAIRKVQKALALSKNNSSDEESQTAMLMAQKIMAKHDLSMNDIELEEESNKQEVIEGDATSYGRLHWWQKQLSSIIADNFRCYSILYRGSGKTKVVFVGKDEDVSIAIEVFKFANESIKHLSKQYMNNRETHGNRKLSNAIKNDYIAGFLQGLKDKFKEQVEKENWGLILVKDDDVVEYFEGLGTKNAKSRSRSTNHDNDAVNAGYNDGKSFNQSRKAIAGV